MSLFGGPQVGVEKLEDVLDHQAPEFPVVAAIANAQLRLQPDTTIIAVIGAPSPAAGSGWGIPSPRRLPQEAARRALEHDP